MDMLIVQILISKMNIYKEIKLKIGLGKEENLKQYKEKMMYFYCIKIQ